jgi:hypothetical protein
MKVSVQYSSSVIISSNVIIQFEEPKSSVINRFISFKCQFIHLMLATFYEIKY